MFFLQPVFRGHEGLVLCSRAQEIRRSTDYYADNLAYKLKAFVVFLFFENHRQFKTLDFQLIFDTMNKPAFIFDGRNILDHNALQVCLSLVSFLTRLAFSRTHCMGKQRAL